MTGNADWNVSLCKLKLSHVTRPAGFKTSERKHIFALQLKRPTWLGFKTAEEGKAKIMQ